MGIEFSLKKMEVYQVGPEFRNRVEYVRPELVDGFPSKTTMACSA